MRKNSVVVDLRMINSSGIGVYLKNIVPEISKEFNLIFLGNPKELAKFSWSKGIRIIEFTPKIYSIKEQLLYPFKIPKTTVFWCPLFNAPFLPIRAKKMVTTIYDANHLVNKNPFLKWLYAKMLYTIAVKRSKRIITISEFSKSELLKYTGAKKDKIKMIYCGVNSAFFNKARGNNTKNIPNRYILYVGNIKPHKNLITLLRAYKNLPESIVATYKLVILGKKEGFITPDLEIFHYIKRNNMMGNIFFTGHLEDEKVPFFYQNASLFVFPSLYEGFGLPILEAMACGVPVLTSFATSLPEVGGDSVVYFDPRNFLELKEKIEKFLLNPNMRKDYAIRGRERARLFSWKTANQKHIEIFRRLIDEESHSI